MSAQRQPARPGRSAFTLIEILIVVFIISILMAALGVTISNILTTAKEKQTIATLQKIDGLINERIKGLERAYDSNDFRRYIEKQQEKLAKGDPANGIPQLFGLSKNAVEAVARKDFFRDFFPQRFAEMTDVRTRTAGSPPTPVPDGIPDRIQFDEVYGDAVTWVPSGAKVIPQNHTQETESAELLYFALTRMEQFGVAATGTDAFLAQEVADTDNDGLPEFVDGWRRPLRFYRWPTRLVKPFGLLGMDGQPGSAGVNEGGGSTDDTQEIGWPGTDDSVVDLNDGTSNSLSQKMSDRYVRKFAGLYIRGLPRPPIPSGTPAAPLAPVLGDYDMLNEDPDDSFGALMAEVKRLAATGILVLQNVSETRYHTADTFHKPMVLSVGPDGANGLYEPYHFEDLDGDGSLDAGEDVNGNNYLDLGLLAQPIIESVATGDLNGNGVATETLTTPVAALDDLTNRNRRAGQ